MGIPNAFEKIEIDTGVEIYQCFTLIVQCIYVWFSRHDLKSSLTMKKGKAFNEGETILLQQAPVINEDTIFI